MICVADHVYMCIDVCIDVLYTCSLCVCAYCKYIFCVFLNGALTLRKCIFYNYFLDFIRKQIWGKEGYGYRSWVA